ncbi:MAG: signal recognition particle-docking protein FtsY [Alphaproteobacteria bacterium]|nr:signal recognition particle-docking protein FtsY [Alphaproteobacteria bacterium]
MLRKPAAVDVDAEDLLDADDRTAPATPRPAPSSGLAQRFFAGLARSREAFARSLGGAFSGDSALEDRLEALEEALIAADVGVKTAGEICQTLRSRAPAGASGADLRSLLGQVLRESIGDAVPLATHDGDGPLVILVVGVNGSGKTTTIGKLATRYIRDGKKVLLAAGDTFRAGAIEQLQVWGERSGAEVVAHQEGADPAAVVFDGVKAGNARGADVVICDTAGRLQAQKTLMDELGKVLRVMKKAQPDAPHEVLIVLDATIGQNALSQAKVFGDVVGVTGVALTKLDGTARGGVVVAVGRELGIPVKLVGLGEGADDLRDFDPDAFVAALLGNEPG